MYKTILNLMNAGGDPALDITATFTEAPLTRGQVAGCVTGVNFSQASTIESDCIEASCLMGEGIWTTAVKSNITLAVNNRTYYWISGAKDASGAIWIADIGYLSPYTSNFVPIETNTGISSSGRFRSYDVPAGIKAVIIKRVTEFSATVAQTLYSFSPLILRTEVATDLKFNAASQSVNLETLSLTLMCLNSSLYKPKVQNQDIFIYKNYQDPFISDVVSTSTQSLVNLIEQTPTLRFGSIINKPATYSTYDLTFSKQAEDLYTNPFIKAIESTCLDESCIEIKPYTLSVDREVNNQSIAFFIIHLSNYIRINSRPDLIPYLNQLSSYLNNQVTQNYMPQGWTNSFPISKSTLINNTSLSVNVVSILALCAAYEITTNPTLISNALVLQNFVFSAYYVPSLKLFKSTPTDKPSLSSCCYGLLLSIFLNRLDISESIINFLHPFISSPNPTTSSQVVDSNQLVFSGSEPVLTNSYTKPSLFNPPSSDIYSEREQEVINCILIDCYNYLSQTISITYIDALQDLANNLKVDFSTSLVPAFELRGTNLVPLLCRQSKYVNFLSSNTYQIYNKILFSWPTDYGWATEKAANTGNLSKLLISLSKLTATTYLNLNKILSSASLTSATGYELDQYCLKEYSITRQPLESDEQFRSRVLNSINKQSLSTQPKLQQGLNFFSIEAKITERYDLTLKASKVNTDNKNYLLGESYYPYHIDIEINKPITADVLSFLKESVPISLSYYLTQSIELKDNTPQSPKISLFID